uniref:Uncharacterized protein n=1 Tax=Octopus bimaculoides TaxID=37653 RepID=A0A0L8GP76_OCTBM
MRMHKTYLVFVYLISHNNTVSYASIKRFSFSFSTPAPTILAVFLCTLPPSIYLSLFLIPL